MCKIIHKMSSKNQASILISTHSMDEVEHLCNKIGIINKGEFIFLGALNEIKEKYGYGYEMNIRIKMIDEKTFIVLNIIKLAIIVKIKPAASPTFSAN